mmetsp:Transcript_2219/g.3398  ORF Transcript_2219/g.3398 Transcript_2219/m.3398 type:complete len:1222 (+) Transcript_2219:501-4166(+)
MSHISLSLRMKKFWSKIFLGSLMISTYSSRVLQKKHPSSGFLLSNYQSLKLNCFITFLSDSSASYRLVGNCCAAVEEPRKRSKSFYLDDIPIGNSGTQSSGLFWEDGSFSGFCMYRRLSKCSAVKTEIHLIPEYSIFNATDLCLSINSDPPTNVLMIEPRKTAPIRKDATNRLVIKVFYHEMNAVAGPIRVDEVGMRTCPIIGNDNSEHVIGTLTLQTIGGSSEAKLVIKIEKMKLIEASPVTKKKLAIFHPLILRVKLSEVQATFLSNTKTDENNPENTTGAFAAFNVCNFIASFEQGFEAHPMEYSKFLFQVGEFSILDFSRQTSNPRVIDSTTDHNFLVLNAYTRGPLNPDNMIDVEFLEIRICASSERVGGKLILNTNEDFLWKMFGIFSCIKRSAAEFYEKFLYNSDSNDLSTFYEPPKKTAMFIFKRVMIAPFTLEVSFERRPEATRYNEVRGDTLWANAANIAIKQLKFKLKNAKLFFPEYEAEYIKAPISQLYQLISAVYFSRLKYKWMVIVSSVSIDDWAVLAGRNTEEDQFVAGDLGRTFGLFLGAALGFTVQKTGMAVGGTIQAASEMIGIGSVGAGANTIISGISSGTSKAIYGAGKGMGQILGGIEGGIGAAKTSVDKGLRSGDVIGAVGELGEGIKIAGTNTATGLQTAALGTAHGIRSASGGLLSGLREIAFAILLPIIALPQSFSVRVFEHPVGRWVSFSSFLLMLVSNILIWTAFATTSAATSKYFFEDRDLEGYLFIRFTSLLFMVAYVPCTFLCSYGAETWGLRNNVLAGSLLTCAGAAFQCLGTSLSSRPYQLFLGGEILVGVGHPFLVNSTELICSNWFGPIGREVGSSLAILAIIGGLFAGKIIFVILLLNGAGGSSHVDINALSMEDVSILLHWNLKISIIAFALGYFMTESAPTIAPSNSARVRKRLLQRIMGVQMPIEQNIDPERLEECLDTTGTDYSASPQSSANNILPLTTVAQYQLLFFVGPDSLDVRLLMASFSFGPTIVICFLLQQQLYELTYTGSCGRNHIIDYTVIMGSSLTGAIIAGIISIVCNASVHFNPRASALLFWLKVFNGVGLVAFCIFVIVAQQSLCALAFLFLMYSSILVLYVENLLECTYPIREDISIGSLLAIAYSIVGAPFSLLLIRLDYYEQEEDHSPCRFFGTVKSNVFVVLPTFLGFILLLLCKNAPQNRSKQERIIGRDSEEQPLLAASLPNEI